MSSGAVRDALAAGQVAEAAELLGYPWFVTGEVVHGDKRGRELGYPTANLRLDPDCGLKHGIYAVRVGIGGTRYDGVASFGRRPMFDNGAVLLEVFLFDFSGDLYGAGARRRLHRLDPAGAEVRQRRGADPPHGRGRRQARDALTRAGTRFRRWARFTLSLSPNADPRIALSASAVDRPATHRPRFACP